MNKKLNFLGTDSGFGNINNSAYFEKKNEFFLIDCGFTVFNEIKTKFDFNKFEKINIIITHLHNDHAGSLSQVIMYLWYCFNKKVTVISECENIRTYLQITGTPIESYDLVERIEGLEFIPTKHVIHLDSYGFILKINDKNIIYTGDTATLVPFRKYFEIMDELYVDVSKTGGGNVHLKMEDVYDELVELKKHGKKVYLMHIDDKEYISNYIKNSDIEIV